MVWKNNNQFRQKILIREAQDVIDTGDGDMKDEILLSSQACTAAQDKKVCLRRICFERVEVKFDLDEDGKPLGIRFREMGTANQLIEEFMLLANKTGCRICREKAEGKDLCLPHPR